MKNLPVHWSEGMFLRPHHFQAADRYWTETLQTSEHWDHHYNYGIRHIEFSTEAIENYQIDVTSCHARLQDGTLLSFDQGLDRVDLRAVFETRQSVKVYLAVPKLKLGGVNVSPAGSAGQTQASGQSRYVGHSQTIQDESSGGNDQEVGLRTLGVRLMLEGDETDGFELLPIAQILRAGDKDPTPQLDENYFPPLLAVDAWHELSHNIVRGIYDNIGKRVERLANQVLSRNINFATQDPVDLLRWYMLMELNTAYAALGTLAFSSGVHPLTVYTELCRILGQLAIFSEQQRRVPDDIPRYDHDDLWRIFDYVRRRIIGYLDAIPEDQYEQRFFEGYGRGMRCRLDPKWLGTDWNWFVGVSFTGNVKESEVRTMLSPGYLNWKLGSERQVDDLYEYGLEGLHLIPQERTPRPLPEQKWIYFQVSRDNNAWRDVMDDESLAMRLNENLILNFDTLSGQRELSIKFEDRQSELQFALFAVQKTS